MDDLVTCSVSFFHLRDVLAKLVASANDHDAVIQRLRNDAARTEERLLGQETTVLELQTQVISATTHAERAKVAVTTDVSAELQRLEGLWRARLEEVDRRTGELEGKHGGLSARHAAVERSLEAVRGMQGAHGCQLTLLQKALDSTDAPNAARGAVTRGQLPAHRPSGTLGERLAALEARLGALGSLQAEVESLKDGAREAGGRLEDHEEQLRRLSDAGQGQGGGHWWRGRPEDSPPLEAPAAETQRLAAEMSALNAKLETEVAAMRTEVGELATMLREVLERGASATARCLCCQSDRKQIETPVLLGSDGKVYHRGASAAAGKMTGDGTAAQQASQSHSPGPARRNEVTLLGRSGAIVGERMPPVNPASPSSSSGTRGSRLRPKSATLRRPPSLKHCLSDSML